MTISIYRRWLAALGLALASMSSAVWADCTMVSSQSIVFGVYSAADGAPLDSTGSISITCTGSGFLIPRPDSGTVSISRGISGTYTARTMSNGAQRLAYNLYTDAARSSVFGDGSESTTTVGFSAGRGILGGPTTANVTVYGRIPARQDVAPGQYVDVLIVTVTY